ncbi:MAG TPA: hypothetical protein VG709_02625, partial [Actinomycetota bacterium]|nr:hypothetical protein [Actinomycetota bacterium]
MTAAGRSMGHSLRNILLLVALCALAVSASACGGGDDDARTPEDVPPDAIALVQDEKIPRSEFDELME